MEEVLEMNLFGDLDLAWKLLHNFSSLITDRHTVADSVNGKQHFPVILAIIQGKYINTQLVK